MTLHLRYSVLCDDVRREDNGKMILIGVYGRQVSVREGPPINLIFSLLLNVFADEPLESDFEMRCLVGGEEKISTKGHLRVTAPGVAWMNIPNIILQDLMEEAELVFQWRIDGEWETIYAIPLVLQEV